MKRSSISVLHLRSAYPETLTPTHPSSISDFGSERTSALVGLDWVLDMLSNSRKRHRTLSLSSVDMEFAEIKYEAETGGSEDGHGGEVRVHVDSPADGDLILVGDDEQGVRFHSFDLKSHSLDRTLCQQSHHVLRLMLDTTLTDPIIRLSDVTSMDLLIVRRAMLHGTVDEYSEYISSGFDGLFAFCEKYALSSVHSIILKTAANICLQEHMKPLFLRAAENDDWLAGILLLSRCRKSEEGRQERHKFLPQQMSAHEVKTLNPVWLHALHQAQSRHVMVPPIDDPQNNAQWEAFTGTFLSWVRLSVYPS